SVMLQRALPFLEGRDRRVTGAIVLVRDVTQLRYRERQLKRQQAVIREVHHRVKNNLQTIASLLRIQGRRVPPEARRELEEATRRIAAIALVHETLSKESGQFVDFAGVAGRLVRMVSEGLLHPESRITVRLEGDPGKLHSDLATPLAVVLGELLQNAVEHAFGEAGGSVSVRMQRVGGLLTMVVGDDGKGLPEGFGPKDKGLGLQIVRALVESELGGKFSYLSNRGASFSVEVPTERPVAILPSSGS
ncbi:MAG: sensor histidine kinase, partial [Actinomycetota bacterium]